jgi:DNA-binding phage protein
MEKIKKQLADKINKALDTSDLWITRKELAKMAGVSETALYNVLKGKASIDSALKVAKVLGIELNVNHDKSHSLKAE